MERRRALTSQTDRTALTGLKISRNFLVLDAGSGSRRGENGSVRQLERGCILFLVMSIYIYTSEKQIMKVDHSRRVERVWS